MRYAICLTLAVAACNQHPKGDGDESLEALAERLRNHPAPSIAQVMPLERGLANIACIGRLDGWQRQYAFALPTTRVDEAVIDFELKQAGRVGIRPGLIRTYPGAFLGNDDTPTKIAAGRYDIRTGKLTLDYCGENVREISGS